MTNAPVVITFQVEGVQALRGIFDSVEARMIQFDRTTSRSQGTGSQERVRGTRREVDQREKEYEKLVRTAAKWEREGVRDAERAALAKVNAEKTAAKQKEKIFEQTTHALARQVSEEVRAVELGEKRKARAIAASAAEENAMRRRYGRAAGRNVLQGLGGMASAATSMLGMGLAVGGGFAITSAARKEMAFGKEVAATSNMSYIPGTTTREEVAPEVIAAMAKKTQGLTNIDKEEVAQGIKRYVGLSSDFQGLSKQTSSGKTGLEELAILSKASGTGLTTLMEAAASIKVANPGMNSDSLISTMRSTLGAGKKGSLPLDVMAQFVGEAQSGAGSFTGSETSGGLAKNQASLIGLVQLAGTMTGGNAARAAMAVKDFSGDIMREGIKSKLMTAKDIYEGGDPRKGLLAPSQLLENVFKKTEGRADLEQKIMGQRSMPLMSALNLAYKQAEAVQKGSGIEAVHNRVQEFTNVSYSPADTMKEFAQSMAADGERIDKAFNHIEEIIEGHVAPFLKKFADALESHQADIDAFLGALAEVAGFMVSHPWQALFMVLEAEMVSSIVKAGISQTIKEAFAGNFAKGIGASIPLVTGAIAALAFAIQGGMAAIDAAVEKSKGDESKSAGLVARAGYLSARVSAGHATESEINEAKGLQAKLGKQVAGEKEGLNPGFSSVVTNPRAFFAAAGKSVGSNHLGLEEASNQLVTEYKQHKALLEELNKTLQGLGGTVSGKRDVATFQRGAGPLQVNHGTPARSDSQADASRGGQRGGG
jgi:hypothetical protein